MNTKIIIIGFDNDIDTLCCVRNNIISVNENIDAINTFSTDDTLNYNKDSNFYYRYYIPYTKVISAFNNNSIVYCYTDNTKSEITTGVMIDDWENGNIMCCSFKEFNLIYNTYIDKCDDILCVCIENKYNDKNQKTATTKTYNRIDNLNIPCLYFNLKNESDVEISDIIIKYLVSQSDEERDKILFENS